MEEEALEALTWEWAPSVLIGLLVITLGYVALTGPIRRRRGWGPPAPWQRQAAFHLGSLMALIALCSPLDSLGDSALFSAHMSQHMLLTFAAPPLWLAGLPTWLIEQTFPSGWPRKLLNWAISPAPALLIFSGVMWAWHIPAIYDAALQSEPLHIFEHLSFMGAGLIGWAPVLVGRPLNQLNGVLRALYLFACSLACTGLAALLTLSGRTLYHFYDSAPRLWGLTQLLDQRLGGLIMWLPGDMLLMLMALVTFGRWLSLEGSSTKGNMGG